MILMLYKVLTAFPRVWTQEGSVAGLLRVGAESAMGKSSCARPYW